MKTFVEFLKRHPVATRILFSALLSGIFAADQGGKTYTAVAGSGGSDYAARLAANRVAAVDFLYGIVFFGLLFLLIAGVSGLRARRKDPRNS